jgi:hypothetical protein
MIFFLHVPIFLLVQIFKNNTIICGLHENDKMSKNTIMVGFLLFKEMHILILPFCVGHIRSYIDLSYMNKYQRNMYIHELF